MADFVSFMVLVLTREQGLGEQQFRVPPQAGDYLSLADENKNAQIYEVVKVIHVTASKASTAGDLVVKHLGPETDVMRRLLTTGKFFAEVV